jgi:thimet oligopeptidase
MMFAINQYKQKHLNVDERKVQEYFPMESTVKALFDIYESFFDLQFVRSEEKVFWHDDVFSMLVFDRKTKKQLGCVILDLYPREGKFTHACCMGVIPPTMVNGEPNTAVTVVLANFPKPSGSKPALLMHDDAETFFHEFGHAIHYIFGRSKMQTVAGYNVKMDFVELPSQMLQEWLWEPAILKRVTSHYQTHEPLPDALIEAKVKSKNAFTGRDSLRQLQFATLSLDIFSAEFSGRKESELDVSKLIREVQPAVLPHVNYPESSHLHCNFGHLTGYAACYYGYMWSEVFALDVFAYIKARNGLLDPAVGRRYAECILSRGGGADPNELLVEFLGRPPNEEAFLKHLGISNGSH